jgi:transcription elongation factor GreA
MDRVKNRLAGELKALEHELRVELPREIKTAVAMGDLRENAEYHAALERQNFVKARVVELRERLAELSMIRSDQIPRDRVGLGSSVTLLDLDTDSEVRYELVVPELSDLAKGLISVASPIGKNLLGLREGDDVTIAIPSGKRSFEVLAFRTIHDAPDE